MAAQGEGFALPAISFRWNWVDQPGYRIYAFDRASYNEGYAAGSIPGDPPTITIVSPAEDTVIGRSVPIVLQVVGDAALRRVIISASYGGDFEEMVHTGTDFSGSFNGGSNSRTVLEDVYGYEFTILRLGGWRAGPIFLRITAIDIKGVAAQKTLAEPQATYTWVVAG
jgi:hypothetical protein